MSQESELLLKIHTELKLFKQQVESAFPRDENGEVDYQAHKQFHKEEIEAANSYKSSKNQVTAHIVGWAIVGLLSVSLSVLTDSHIISALVTMIKSLH